MTGGIRRVAMVSMHSSPADQPGSGDAGGMNVVMLDTAAQLSLLGIEVDLLTRATGRPAVTELLPGVTLRSLEAGPPGRVGDDGIAKVADEFGEQVAMLAGRDASRYDLIHAHHWSSGLATLPVSIELGLPFVQSFHGLEAMRPDSGAEPGAERVGRIRGEAFLASQADAIIAASGAEVAALIDAAGAPADRVWVIPHGVDPFVFGPTTNDDQLETRRRLGIESDRPIVAIAGRIRPDSGQDLAIRALAELHALRGWAPVLVVAGSPATGEEAFADGLRGLAVDLGVASDVRFVGALDRESLAGLFAAASITLLPSTGGATGLAALESAASGTPILASRPAGLAASIVDGVTGFVVDSDDPREWALEMVVVLDDPDQAAELAAASRAHAEQFSWSSAAASLLGVYTSLG